MSTHEIAVASVALFALAAGAFAQSGGASSDADQGPYARIGFLKPRDGNTVDFEAGYVRHLEWHRKVSDPFVWYGWTISAGERQRWLVYATFGHPAGAFDAGVNPAEDERDNVANIMPHSEFAGGGFYEFLPALSRGSGVPTPVGSVEMTTVDLVPGAAKAFEAAVAARQSKLPEETLWYRMIAGGSSPRYVRLRPRANLAAILASASEPAATDEVSKLVEKMTVEILSLRPTMSYGLPEGK